MPHSMYRQHDSILSSLWKGRTLKARPFRSFLLSALLGSLEQEWSGPAIRHGTLLAVAQVNLAPALGDAAFALPGTNLVATGTSEDALVVHAVAGIALLHAVVIAMRIKREVLRGRLTRPGHDAGTRVATALQAELIGVGHLGERRIVIAGQLGLHHAGRGAQGVLMAVKALSIHNGLVGIRQRIGLIFERVVILADVYKRQYRTRTRRCD